MAKQTGLGDGLVVDGIDLSGDTGSISTLSKRRATTGQTGIDKFAFERKHLLRDGEIGWSFWYNPDNAHPELSSLPTDNRIASYLRGQSLGNPSACMVARQINYDPTRNQDGSLSGTVQTLSDGFGLEWGHQLTDGFEEFTSTGAGSSVDPGSGTTAFGLQAYLHVLALTGTDVDVAIHDDNGAVTGGAFPTMDGIGSARIQTGRTVSVTAPFNINITGTFTSVTLMVAVIVNLHSVRF